jgi:hypothetical protein
MAYTKEEAIQIKELLRDHFPYVDVTFSTLGGTAKASILIRLSMDPKEEWANNIFHNSRYAHFSLHPGSKLEQFSRSRTSKFRKCTIKSVEHAAEKIIKWKETV